MKYCPHNCLNTNNSGVAIVHRKVQKIKFHAERRKDINTDKNFLPIPSNMRRNLNLNLSTTLTGDQVLSCYVRRMFRRMPTIDFSVLKSHLILK